MSYYCIGCYQAALGGATVNPFVRADFQVSGTALCGTCASAAYGEILGVTVSGVLAKAAGRAAPRKPPAPSALPKPVAPLAP